MYYMDKEIEAIKDEINSLPYPKQVLLISKYSLDKIKEKFNYPLKYINKLSFKPICILILASVPSIYIYNKDKYF